MAAMPVRVSPSRQVVCTMHRSCHPDSGHGCRRKQALLGASVQQIGEHHKPRTLAIAAAALGIGRGPNPDGDRVRFEGTRASQLAWTWGRGECQISALGDGEAAATQGTRQSIIVQKALELMSSTRIEHCFLW